MFRAKHVSTSILTLISVLAVFVTCHGQNFDERVQTFYNSQTLPEQFNHSILERVDSIVGSGDVENDDFILRTDVFSARLDRSGEVFFGDSISLYLNSLKDSLLAEDPRRDDIQIHLTCHPSLNAFATGLGKIYVNLAAFVQLENEDELLAILAHEISHVLAQHSLEQDLFNQDLEDEIWEGDEEEALLQKHAFSREHEYEADLMGFQLLKEKQVDLHRASNLFSKIRYDLDPAIGGQVSLRLLAGNSDWVWEQLRQDKSSIEWKYPSIVEKESDSLSTHPSPASRLDQLHDLINSQDTITRTHTLTEFDQHKEMANAILVESYIENGWFIEGLDLVLKMRTNHPSDLFLAKAQAKLLVLLTQEKYRATSFDRFINPYGSAYQDENFMMFREQILTYNSLEFNALSLGAVKSLNNNFNDDYIERTYEFLVMFMYKFNPELYVGTTEGLGFIHPRLTSRAIERVNTLDPILTLSLSQRARYDSLTTLEGVVPTIIHDVEKSRNLIRTFLENNSIGPKEKKYIRRYKKRRARFEFMFTVTDVDFILDPDEAFEKYEDPEISEAPGFDQASVHGLIDCYALTFIEKREDELFLDLEESLISERKAHVIIEENPHVKNLSLCGSDSLDVEYVRRHYYLGKWAQERFECEDLNYSVVDEHFERISESLDVRYLMTTIHLGIKMDAGDNISLAFKICFDADHGGVVYIGRWAEKTETEPKIIDHFYDLTTD